MFDNEELNEKIAETLKASYILKSEELNNLFKNYNTFPSTPTFCSTLPKVKPTVTLQAETSISLNDMTNIPADELEYQIKKDLIRQLVKQILDEDLIELRTNENIETCTKTIRASLKIIQE